MNNMLPIESVLEELAAWVSKNAHSPEEQTRLARRLFDGLAEKLQESVTEATHITAPNAVVEVMDETSGHLYRRYLEVAYDESENGLRLIGEDMKANQVQIVFLSETALARMKELHGGGPDAPRCHD